MRIYIVNTAFESKNGGSCKNGLMRMIRGGVAAAWLEYQSETVFRSFRGGDIVLLYENGRGYVAIGRATGEFRLPDAEAAIDRENFIEGDEHQQVVRWEFYVPGPGEGYRGLRHGLTTCFSKELDDNQTSALWAFFRERAKPVSSLIAKEQK